MDRRSWYWHNQSCKLYARLIMNPFPVDNSGRRFQLLHTAPAYQSADVVFSATRGTFRGVGLFVKIIPSQASEWLACFHPSDGMLEKAWEFHDSERILVVTGGFGYIFSAQTRELYKTFGGTLESYWSMAPLEDIVLSDGFRLYRVGSGALLWKSDRLSLDGIGDVRRLGETLTARVIGVKSGRPETVRVDVKSGIKLS